MPLTSYTLNCLQRGCRRGKLSNIAEVFQSSYGYGCIFGNDIAVVELRSKVTISLFFLQNSPASASASARRGTDTLVQSRNSKHPGLLDEVWVLGKVIYHDPLVRMLQVCRCAPQTDAQVMIVGVHHGNAASVVRQEVDTILPQSELPRLNIVAIWSEGRVAH